MVPSQGPFRITATQGIQEYGESEWCVGVSRTSFIDKKDIQCVFRRERGYPPPTKWAAYSGAVWQ